MADSGRRAFAGGTAALVLAVLATVGACTTTGTHAGIKAGSTPGSTTGSTATSPTAPVSIAPPAVPTTPARPATRSTGASGHAGPPLVASGFRVASFNILGASHTAPGGDMAARPSGTVRAAGAVEVLAERGVDVVGMQEVEPPAYRAFLRRSHGAWTFFPGRTKGDRDLADTIGWRTHNWTLVHAKLFSIPYFHGNVRDVPIVLLRNRHTGRRVYFLNVHNPADTGRFGPSATYRLAALEREVAQLRLLDRTGIPIVVTGDFNAKRPPLCALTAVAGVHAADGSTRASRGCVPSAVAGVDWIFGSRGVRFSGYVTDKDALVSRTSDHPIVCADVTLTAP